MYFFHFLLGVCFIDVQTGNISDNDSVNYSWTSDEELEIEKKVFDSGTSLTTLNGGLLTGTAEVSNSIYGSNSFLTNQLIISYGFVNMFVSSLFFIR